MNYDRYQNALATVADDVERELAELAGQRHRLTQQELAALIAGVLERAQARAVALADVYVAAALTEVTGTDVLPTGARRSRRHLWPVATVLALIEEHGGVEEFAATIRARVYDTGAATWNRALRKSAPDHGVGYWTRRPEPATKCPVCTGLADGRALRLDTPMVRHSGCRCVQEPTAQPDFAQR